MREHHGRVAFAVVEGPDCIEWDDRALGEAVQRVAADGVIEAAGVRLSPEQLLQLCDLALRDPQLARRRVLPSARFDGSMFTDDVGFVGVEFAGNASFRDAVFTGDAIFARATFAGAADFRGATFRGSADFRGATFSGDADFRGAIFAGDAKFDRPPTDGAASGDASSDGSTLRTALAEPTDDPSGSASFGSRARFRDATFQCGAMFRGSTFAGDADFENANFNRVVVFRDVTFMGNADFSEATFGARARFRGSTVGGSIDFRRATFDGARTLAVCMTGEENEGLRRVIFNNAVFARPIRIEVCADGATDGTVVFCQRTVFRGGVDLLVQGVSLSLEDADFAAPSLLAPLPASSVPSQPGLEAGGRLVTLRRAKVADLTVTRLDLRACRFADAHGLDSIRLERVQFAQPPKRIGLRWRWSRRQTIAEEHLWREERHPGSGWYDGAVCAPSWVSDAATALSADEIAGIYRSLRKSREDAKNEPGAASLYYGEMELRRRRTRTLTGARTPSFNDSREPGDSRGSETVAEHIRPASSVERYLLLMYWLVAGYGLRASRALAALALTIALTSIPLSLWGFHPHQPYEGYGRAMLFALESSTSLLRAPTASLTASGQLIEIFVRLAGPLFFGLALLSLRGRVKR